MNELLEHLSYFGIVIALVLTGLGLPVPEEVIIIGAGLASSPGAQGQPGALNPWLAILSCWVGELLGDLCTYAFGRHFGRNIVKEHPFFAGFLTPAREQHIEQMINRHGPKVFFVARFLVGLRSPMYLTAGILRYPLQKFLFWNSFCAGLVILVFFTLSYRFAAQIKGWWEWIRHAEIALTVLIVVSVAGVVLFFYLRHRRRVARIKRRRLDRAPLGSPPSPDPGTDSSQP